MTAPSSPRPDCPLCGPMGEYFCDDLMVGAPTEVVLALLGRPPYDAEGTVPCPRCGAGWRYRYTCGFGEHDVELMPERP